MNYTPTGTEQPLLRRSSLAGEYTRRVSATSDGDFADRSRPEEPTLRTYNEPTKDVQQFMELAPPPEGDERFPHASVDYIGDNMFKTEWGALRRISPAGESKCCHCRKFVEKSFAFLICFMFVVLATVGVVAAWPLSQYVIAFRNSQSVVVSYVISAGILLLLLVCSAIVEYFTMKIISLLTARTFAWPLFYYASSFEVSFTFMLFASCALSLSKSLVASDDVVDKVEHRIYFYYTRTCVVVLMVTCCQSLRVLGTKMWLLHLRKDAFVQRMSDINVREIFIARMSRAAIRMQMRPPSGRGYSISNLTLTPFTTAQGSLNNVSPLVFVRYASALVKDGLVIFDGSDKLTMVTSVVSAAQKAEELFAAFKSSSGEEMTVEDFLFAGFGEKEAADAFSFFDSARTGSLSVEQFRDKVVSVYTDRCLLADTMHDWDLGSKVFSNLFTLVFWMVMAFCGFLVFEINISQFLVPLGFSAAAMTMTLGTFTKEFFDSLLMVFVVRPFFVGDLVEIQRDTVPMYVEAIYVLSTKFRTQDNRVLQMRNHEIAKLPIVNYRKSGSAWITIKVKINLDTPDTKLAELRRILVEHINTCGHWKPTKEDLVFTTAYEDLEATKKILFISAESLFTWKQYDPLMLNKSRLVEFVQSTLVRLHMPYQQNMVPVMLFEDPKKTEATMKASLKAASPTGKQA